MTSLITVAKNVSYTLNSFYCMDGMLRLCKWGIANVRLLAFSPRIGNLFSQLLPVLEAQKAIYYASLTFSGLPYCFKVDDKTKQVTLQLPQMADGSGIDWVRLFYLMGGIFDTGHCIQKGGLANFGLYSAIGSRLGAVKVFTYHGAVRTFDQVPVLNTVCLAPKELFFILASIVEMTRWAKPLFTEKWREQFELLPLLKLTASVGRLIGLSCYRYYGTTWQLATIEFAAQNAGIIRFCIISQKRLLAQ